MSVPLPLLSPELAAIPGCLHGFGTRDASPESTLPSPLLRLRQVHGDVVHSIAEDTDLAPYLRPALEDRPAGDALVSTRPGVTVAVATADCVPVLVACPEGAVAAIHAGWRGVVAGIVAAAFRELQQRLGGAPRGCVAAIGPSIGGDVYEVGPEVREAFSNAGLPDALCAPGAGDRFLCDVAGAVAWQLREAGVTTIGRVPGCTLRDPARFHSWRRDGARAGRMLSAIALTPRELF